MTSDKFFLADPARLPELALAADGTAADRGAARPRPLPATPWLAAALARAAGWFAVALARSRQRRALSALSDHLLRDAGLTREDFLARTRMRWPRD